MGDRTGIEWTDHTFNPWVGCTKISAACDNCYAETWAKRAGSPELWHGERRRTSVANWQKPIRWNIEAASEGRRHRVFCASLADFFDNQVPTRWRDDAWHRIAQTPNLDWQLLTKRPENIRKMLPTPAIGAPEWGDGWKNVWIGTTVEDRAAIRRIDTLRSIPATIRFLSVEPLLEYIGEINLSGISWVICGGESGTHARPMHPAWARSIRDQCNAANVPFFFKQWGEWAPGDTIPIADGARDCPDGTLEDNLCGKLFYAGNGRSTTLMRRVGKARAGRLLDGVEHSEFPDAW